MTVAYCSVISPWRCFTAFHSASSTTRTALRQTELHHSERARGMSLRDPGMYRQLLEHLRSLLPRLPEELR